MEIINLAGYTIEEKLHIARKYLVPRQIAANGLRPGQVKFQDQAIVEIISNYTREAGVRNVEREIGTICRKIAREVAEASNGNRRRFTVNVKKVHELLGRPRLFSDVKRRTSDPGVATGLAWTPVGGDILFIEATAMPGTGHLTVTGQLGDVMKESAMAAMSYVRTHSPELGLDDDYFQTHDIHIHVPAGAIPKDGPSAGVTMATAICSLVTDTPVNNDVAMTGEVTLTGQVLPIGGLKEKTLAAQRAGITTVILPSRNEADLEDVPEELRKGMTFVPVDRVEQVWEAAMGLRLDERAAQLIEAGDLIEEAGELLEKARRKAGNRMVAEADGRAAGDRRRPRKKPAAQGAGAQGAGQAARPRARRRGPRRRRPSPRARPRRPRPRAAGAAARSSRRAAAGAARPRRSAGRRAGEASPPRPVVLRCGRALAFRSCSRRAAYPVRGPAPAPPARSARRDPMAGRAAHGARAPRARPRSPAAPPWRAPSPASPCSWWPTLAPVWAAVAGSWTALVVVVACVIDGLADGIFAWLRARASFAAGVGDGRAATRCSCASSCAPTSSSSAPRPSSPTWSSAACCSSPAARRPTQPGAAFVTWQYWAVVGGARGHARRSSTGGTSCAAARPP